MEEEHPLPHDLYERKEIILKKETVADSLKLRILGWNILADCKCKLFPKAHEKYLTKEYRLPLIFEEIKQASYSTEDGPRAKKRLPDLLLFQEMDMQDEILEHLNSLDMEIYGEVDYTYEFIDKNGHAVNALAIFYDTLKYKLLYAKKDHYREADGVTPSRRCYLMTLFEHIETGKKFAACTIHLKSKAHFGDTREKEIKEYFEKIAEFQQEIEGYGFLEGSTFAKLPILLCGDFNDDPESPVVKSVLEDYHDHGIDFKCAYQIDGEFPDFSTYTYRTDDVTKRCIDYMFYNEHLNLMSIRDIPDESEVASDIGHPCHRYPSDHFALAATFELV